MIKLKTGPLFILLAVILISGWRITAALERHARADVAREALSSIESLSAYLSVEFKNIKDISSIMAGSSWMRLALKTGLPENIGKSSQTLDRYSHFRYSGVLYLLDAKGFVISSSNRGDKDSFVGKNYGFRPYFKESIKGNPSEYFSIGVTSGKRGYYASHPVRDESGNILGVNVIKLDIDKMVMPLRHNTFAMLVNKQGIIFMASDPGLVFKSLYPLKDGAAKTLADSGQFGPGPFESIINSKVQNGSEILYNNKPFIVSVRPVGPEGWDVVTFFDMERVLVYRWIGILFTIFLGSLAVLFFIIIYKQKEISRSAGEWQKTFDSISDMVFVQDINNTIIRANEAFAKALNVRPDDIIGKKCYELLHEQDKPWHNCPFELTKNSKETVTREVDDPKIGIPLLVTTSPVFDEKGKLIGAVHISKDITEIRQMERKKAEIIETKSNFISMVSHELRTPITAIKEGISIVADEIAGKLNDEQKDFLGTAKRNLDRLSRLVNNVLDIQKMDAGKIEFKIEDNDINSAIEEAYKQTEFLIKDKGLEFLLELDGGLPNIKFDRDRIIQVITNLVSNAFKFTQKGGITIASRLAGNMVRVSVRDTGPGIKQDDLSELFQRFKQLDRGKGTNIGGSGLGLAISKEIIERHGGKVWAESKPGEGSVFSFTLPVKERRSA